MSGTNITRAEAAARSAIVQVQSYDVHVDLSGVRDAVATTFPSTTTVHFTATAGASTWIDLIAPRIQRATLNGTALDAAGSPTARPARCPASPRRTRSWSTPTARYSNTGEGLHRFVDPVDREVYLYTPVRDRRRAAGVRLLRPARPEGDVHASP